MAVPRSVSRPAPSRPCRRLHAHAGRRRRRATRRSRAPTRPRSAACAPSAIAWRCGGVSRRRASISAPPASRTAAPRHLRRARARPARRASASRWLRRRRAEPAGASRRRRRRRPLAGLRGLCSGAPAPPEKTRARRRACDAALPPRLLDGLHGARARTATTSRASPRPPRAWARAPRRTVPADGRRRPPGRVASPLPTRDVRCASCRERGDPGGTTAPLRDEERRARRHDGEAPRRRRRSRPARQRAAIAPTPPPTTASSTPPRWPAATSWRSCARSSKPS